MTRVHPHALVHGLGEQEIASAWENYLVGAVRQPGETELRVGIDPLGREVEMVGALLADGEWLVYHAVTPPSKRTRQELRRAMGRRK